jgi:short-subunit dehydrogenase
MSDVRPLAVVTGASTGIGYELAKLCAKNGFDHHRCRRAKARRVIDTNVTGTVYHT